MTGLAFDGFRRPDGAVGVRNHVLILSVTGLTGLTGPTARRIGRAVPGARVVTTPYGSGLVGDDAALQRRAAGTVVIKYGQCISQTTAPVRQGGWVHVHNLRSRRAQAAGDETA